MRGGCLSTEILVLGKNMERKDLKKGREVDINI